MTEQPGGPSVQAVECAESVRQECMRGEGRVEMLAGGGVAGGTTLHWDARRAAELIQRAIDGALAERDEARARADRAEAALGRYRAVIEDARQVAEMEGRDLSMEPWASLAALAGPPP